MSKVSALIVVEPAYALGRFAVVRRDAPDFRSFIWCGRSMGWLPLDTTSPVFVKLFDSEDAAQAAGEKACKLTLPPTHEENTMSIRCKSQTVAEAIAREQSLPYIGFCPFDGWWYVGHNLARLCINIIRVESPARDTREERT